MDGMAGSMDEDPESGLLLVPAHEAKFSVGVALWDDTVDVYRSFVRRSLADGWEKSVFRAAVKGRCEKQAVLPVVVQLVPRPDNEYNPKAISVAAPPGMGGTAHERHMGYMYERNLVSLGAPLRSLAAVSGRPVGCHGLVELHEVDERWKDADEEAGDTFHIRGARRTYSVYSLRLRLPWWEDLQAMTVAYARSVRPDLILPFISHWTSYSEGAREALLRRTDQKEFPVTLRVENDRLLAYYEDLELSVLVPSGRDFFDRTMSRVQELGGTATALAEEHGGALKVFVEDNSPVDLPAGPLTGCGQSPPLERESARAARAERHTGRSSQSASDIPSRIITGQDPPQPEYLPA
ncbi:hypothetical protein [Streptomyces sp. NPDC001292]|uniref:hypothetical protein n=1 Tax=Streptomyces sp. NPDC001292 TaxID=3364558 RepID=UPI003691AB61